MLPKVVYVSLLKQNISFSTQPEGVNSHHTPQSQTQQVVPTPAVPVLEYVYLMQKVLLCLRRL